MTTGNLHRLPARGMTAPPGDADCHPRWSDNTPILLGQEVTHRTHRWSGVVEGIPSSEEVLVSWWMDEDEWTDGEEFSPDDLLRAAAR